MAKKKKGKKQQQSQSEGRVFMHQLPKDGSICEVRVIRTDNPKRPKFLVGEKECSSLSMVIREQAPEEEITRVRYLLANAIKMNQWKCVDEPELKLSTYLNGGEFYGEPK